MLRPCHALFARKKLFDLLHCSAAVAVGPFQVVANIQPLEKTHLSPHVDTGLYLLLLNGNLAAW